MIRHTIYLILSIISATSAVAAENATDILSKASERIKTTPSINASYTLDINKNSVSGNITISGEKFHMTSPNNITIWFDGKTQWTYNPTDNEISITEPTSTELQQINPLTIIANFKEQYNATLLKSNTGTKKIRLTAKKAKYDITTAVITLNATTLYPTEIMLTMPNKTTATIYISNIKTGKILPISTFRFDRNQNPKAEIIDLR